MNESVLDNTFQGRSEGGCAYSRSLETTAFPDPSVSFSSGIISFLIEFQGIPWWWSG